MLLFGATINKCFCVKAKIVQRCEEYVYSSICKYLNFKNESVDEMLVLTRYGDTSAGSYELIKA